METLLAFARELGSHFAPYVEKVMEFLPGLFTFYFEDGESFACSNTACWRYSGAQALPMMKILFFFYRSPQLCDQACSSLAEGLSGSRGCKSRARDESLSVSVSVCYCF